MRRQKFTLACIAVGVFAVICFLQCSLSPVAGGGTNTGDAIVGMVYIEDGIQLKPAPHATVIFVHNKAHPDTAIELSVKTDERGVYTLSWDDILPQDTYNIFAEKSSKKAFVRSAITNKKYRSRNNGITDTIEPITLQDAVTLRGLVKVEEPFSYTNVDIAFLGTPYSRMTPDNFGSFSKDSIASGIYDVRVLMTNSLEYAFTTSFHFTKGSVAQPYIKLNSSLMVVDSCEGDEQNNLWGYWYVYDDNERAPDIAGSWDPVKKVWKDSLAGGDSRITNFSKISAVEYEPFAMTDMASDGGNIKGTPGHAAKISFHMGEKQPHSSIDSTYGNFIGIGTQLVPDDSSKGVIDISKGVRISYWAKASEPMSIACQIITQQAHFDLYSTFYQIMHQVTGEWAHYTVLLREKDPTLANDSLYIIQPAWAFADSALFHHPDDPPGVNSGIQPFDVSKTTAIQWMVSCDDNPQLQQKNGTLWIDDIVIQYYDMDITN